MRERETEREREREREGGREGERGKEGGRERESLPAGVCPSINQNMMHTILLASQQYT